jgi:hypothetical protein
LSAEGDYAWELATLYPEQGEWSEEAYLELTDHANHRIEFADGRLEFLPMPTEIHEALVQYLFWAKSIPTGSGCEFGRISFACPISSSCTRITFTFGTTASGMEPIW